MHVVVIGASVAGLFTAAAAAANGCRVTLLERDVLAAGPPEPRPGVPQGAQLHVFLHRGVIAAETLLPGLTHDLAHEGAVPVDTTYLPWLGEHGWTPAGVHGYTIWSCTRPLLEGVVRRRVTALAGVEVRDGVHVDGLRRHGTGWQVVVKGAEPLTADAVVDASGRSSRLAAWLSPLGVPAPVTKTVDARLGYATRRYRGDAASGAVVLATTDQPRGGLALPVEGGQWLVVAVGFGQDRPPRDAEGFEAHLGRLRDPAVADVAAVLTPVGDVAVHRQTANVRRHYGRLRSWPAGLLVVGDALCSFDPIYGQGITVAACQAVELGPRLTGVAGDARATRRLQRRIARIANLPWAIATGEDARFPTSGTGQTRSQALFSAWAREVGHLGVCGDRRAGVTLSTLYHLMGSPWALLHPALFTAAARARVRGYGPSAPRPAVLSDGPGLTAEPRRRR